MSVLCTLAVAVGLSLGGTCISPEDTPRLPNDEKRAWLAPPPPPEPVVIHIPPPAAAPAPAPAPPMPPVVIRETIIQQAPPPPPVEPPPEHPNAELIAANLNAALAARRQASWGMDAVTGIPQVQTISTGRQSATAPIAPLASPLGFNTGLPPIEAPAEYQTEGRTSTAPVDNSRIVAADRYINGVLEKGINSQLDGTTGGSLVIQVSRDVYGYHGRNVLIPKGSRLVCQYQSPEDMGSSRLGVRCGRILLGESRAEIYQLKAGVFDQQGRLGVTGEVDGRFVERYGTAFALAGIATMVRVAAASTTTSETAANQSSSLTTGAEELSQKLGEITAATLEQSLDLTPIITVPQGTRITIQPTYDWYIKPVS